MASRPIASHFRDSVVLTSTALYASAFWLTKLLHEGAHALAGVAMGTQPVLHTSFVEQRSEPGTLAMIVTCAAGPLFSGASGALLWWLHRRGERPWLAQLALVWMAYHGVVNLVGYVFTTAFAAGGDLGRIARLLAFPLPASIAVSVLGLWLIRSVWRPFARTFSGLGGAGAEDDVEATRAAILRVATMPAMLGTPLVILSALPVPHWLELVYAACAGLPMFEALDRAKLALAPRAPLQPAPPVRAAWVACTLGFVVLVVVSRLLLDDGIALGR